MSVTTMAPFCGYYLVMASRSTRIRGKDSKSQVTYERQIPLSERYSNYIDFVKDYPKMHCNKKYFVSRISKTERLIADNKNWLNHNKNGEKMEFLSNFSVDKWDKLMHANKLQHSFDNCAKCDGDLTRHFFQYGSTTSIGTDV
jgi:hypothetical protein